MSFRTTILIGLLAAILGIGGTYYLLRWQDDVNSSLFASCHNHERFIEWELWQYLEGNKNKLPYAPGIPGYGMIVGLCKNSRANMNCHFGAPDERGACGWQAVNLPPDAWLKLHKLWMASGEQENIPFYWNGKPNSLEVRIVIVPIKSNNERWFIQRDTLKEEELVRRVELLNTCLKAMGEKPVPLNIPDNINWKQFYSVRVATVKKEESSPAEENGSPAPLVSPAQ